METTPIFDLSAAIDTWRQEFLAQPHLTPDDRRELETHLRDTIVELRDLGLDERDSFLLARRRTGPAQSIAAEYAKADPARIWRGRIFWMAVAIFITWEWGSVVESLRYLIPVLHPRSINGNSSSFFIELALSAGALFFTYLPLFFCAAWLAEGRAVNVPLRLGSVFDSRPRFIVSALLAAFSIRLLRAASIWLMNHHRTSPASFLSPFLLAVPLIGLIAWLMPARSSRPPIAA